MSFFAAGTVDACARISKLNALSLQLLSGALNIIVSTLGMRTYLSRC